MGSKNDPSLESIDDILLGLAGVVLPPSHRLDHAVRFCSTWAGSDKLMMTAQYTAKLLAPLFLFRSKLQFRAGRRAKPVSITAEGLHKFASHLSIARRLSGLWGIIAIVKSLSALERSRPDSRLKLNLQRLQGISMLVFYPLEYISIFTSPFAPILHSISPLASMKAQLWSIRAWGAYVVLQTFLLSDEWKELRRKEQISEKGVGNVTGNGDMAIIKKRKEAIIYQLVANLARMPVIFHWSVIGGIYKSDLWTNSLSFISAVAALLGGWEATRIPAPMR